MMSNVEQAPKKTKSDEGDDKSKKEDVTDVMMENGKEMIEENKV